MTYREFLIELPQELEEAIREAQCLTEELPLSEFERLWQESNDDFIEIDEVIEGE